MQRIPLAEGDDGNVGVASAQEATSIQMLGECARIGELACTALVTIDHSTLYRQSRVPLAAANIPSLLYEGCREASGEAVISAASKRVRAVGVLYRPSLDSLDESTGVLGSSPSFCAAGTGRAGVTMRCSESPE